MPKLKIQIKHYLTGSVLFEYESDNNTIYKTLKEAIKSGANLRGANLRGANLYGANLRGAKNNDYTLAQTIIVPEGTIIGWKMAWVEGEKVIIKLRIPEEAKRSNASGRKCRAESAEVLAIYPKGKKRVMARSTVARSDYDHSFTYKAGDILKPSREFDENRWEECAPGIHFFITRIEAENY